MDDLSTTAKPFTDFVYDPTFSSDGMTDPGAATAAPAKKPTADLLLVSFDLEATGLKVFTPGLERDQITEIGACGVAVWIDGPDVPLRWQFFETDFKEYVHASKAMSDKVAHITKISHDDLKKARPFSEVRDAFGRWIDMNCDKWNDAVPRVLIGQNVFKFDVPMLTVQIEDSGMSAENWFRLRRFSYCVDTLLISRDAVDCTQLPIARDGRPCYALGGVYKAMTGKELIGAHGALFDSRAVLALLLQYDTFSKPFRKDVFLDTPKYTCNLMKLVSTSVASIPKKGASSSSGNANPVKKLKTLHSFFPTVATTTNVSSVFEVER